MSDSYKLNGSTFKAIEIRPKESGCRNNYYCIELDATIYATEQSFIDLGAALVKEPRTMSMWEWRKFPGVKFYVGDLACSWRKGMDGKYRLYDEDLNDVNDVNIELLESVGTEVLE